MLFTEFAQRIKKVYMIAGQNLPESFEIICKDIYDRIPKELTDREVEYVLAEGVFKKFGNYEFVKPVLIHEWFQIFRTSDYRQQLFPKKEQNQLPASVPLHPDELRKSCINHLKNAFNDYKKEGKFTDIGGCNYNFLKRENLLDITDELHDKFYEDARKKAHENVANSKILNDFAKSIKMREIVAKLADKSKNIPAVDVEYQTIVVNWYFEHLVKLGMEITDVVE